jgi:exodeoxyribonuclease V
MIPSPDQAAALAEVERFLRAPRASLRRPFYVIHGLAGVGKSETLAELARRHAGQATVCTFTNRAASVLRKRSGLRVTTIHSVIYRFTGMAEDEEEPEKMVPTFEFDAEDALPDRTILVDECSMVGTRIAEDLISTGARLVLTGDYGQLPPVKDKQYFTDPDFTLTEIHRQALDSPIIRQAHRVRSDGTYADDGPGFRVVSRASPEDLLAADVVVCWRNRTRRRVNARKRELLGLAGPLRAGEPVVVLKNDYKKRIFNGQTFPLAMDLDPDDQLAVLDADGRQVFIDRATVEDHDPEFERRKYDEEWMPLAAAYAMTAHKLQGGEYENVLVLDEYDRSDGFRRNWLYTAITRAISQCVVVRWR